MHEVIQEQLVRHMDKDLQDSVRKLMAARVFIPRAEYGNIISADYAKRIPPCQPNTSSSKADTSVLPSDQAATSRQAQAETPAATPSSAPPAATSGPSAPLTACHPSCSGLTVVCMEGQAGHGHSYRARCFWDGTQSL